MSRITLQINGRSIDTQAGTLLLQAARQAGIVIPSLCFGEGYIHYTSCMLCLVEDRKSGKLVPACSVKAEDGMEIETENSRITAARKDTLELLLSEHTGDCFAPCERTCPAHYRIPLVLRHLENGNYPDAMRMIREELPFAAVIGRICPAPCEKACRRKKHDAAVSIRILEQITGDYALALTAPLLPAPASGKAVAIVGAGPAGLSTAFFLIHYGYSCTIFDSQNKPGGALRSAIPAHRLDPAILDAEIERILLPHVRFKMNCTIGVQINLDTLRTGYAAVILTPGTASPALFPGLEMNIQPGNHTTNFPGVFAGGAFTKPMKMAVSGIADGKELAVAVHRYLSNQAVPGARKPFLCTIGNLTPAETEGLVQQANPEWPLLTANSANTPQDAGREAARCLHCECGKLSDCALRTYSLSNRADAHKYGRESRSLLERRVSPGGIVFEPGKCIKCGLCVRITASTPHGMCFLHRGYEITINTPFDIPLEIGLGAYAALCVTACPSGALSYQQGKGVVHEEG